MKKMTITALRVLFTLLITNCSTDNKEEDDTQNSSDKIVVNLTTAITAYESAEDNEWVEITETEYNNLYANLNNVVLNGSNQAEYNSSSAGISPLPERTVANYTNSAKIPANHYLFAFKYSPGNTPVINNANVRQSYTANNNGFNKVGFNLPSHTNATTSVYFVLKGSNAIQNSDSYLGMYSPGFVNRFASAEGSATIKDGPNFMAELSSNSTDRKFKYQGLSTAEKQW